MKKICKKLLPEKLGNFPTQFRSKCLATIKQTRYNKFILSQNKNMSFAADSSIVFDLTLSSEVI